jgi:hypothetical protein
MERREALRLPCSVRLGGPEGAWLASDFGPGGLCLHGGRLPAVDTWLPFEWIVVGRQRVALRVRARVAWRQDGRAGLDIPSGDAQHHAASALYRALLDAFLAGV